MTIRKMTITILTIAALLLPSRAMASAETKMVRTLDGRHIEVDTSNVAYAEEEDDTIAWSDLVHHAPADPKPWVNKKGKKYLPFTDQYLNTNAYEKFLKRVQTQATIKAKKAGTLSTKSLQLKVKTKGNKTTLSVHNRGKKTLTETRMYFFSDGKKLRVFIDTAEGQIAYTELSLSEVKSAQIREQGMTVDQLTIIGIEALELEQLMSTDGARISADGDGKIAAKEEVVITLK